MKFEDRIQLRLSDLTEELFENIVAYGFHAPSGMGGPGCVIMIAEDGRSYQFYGPDLNKLNYHREWVSLFPVLNQCDTSQWKLAENVSCTKLLVRNDIYDLFMENRSTPEETIDYRWEDSCIKATLLLHARTEEEIEKILEERKRAWRPKEEKYKSGVLKIYSEHAVSPMKGGYMK